jgi:hypothetical protein
MLSPTSRGRKSGLGTKYTLHRQGSITYLLIEGPKPKSPFIYEVINGLAD